MLTRYFRSPPHIEALKRGYRIFFYSFIGALDILYGGKIVETGRSDRKIELVRFLAHPHVSSGETSKTMVV